jgi:uncharacterized repeat protein (TIGR01451 family)
VRDFFLYKGWYTYFLECKKAKVLVSPSKYNIVNTLRRVFGFLAVAMVVVLSTTGLLVAQTNDLVSELSVFKVTKDAKGKETFEDTSNVKPGDVIEYRLVYTNKRTDVIQNLKPVLPVPQGTTYLDNTAAPKLSAVMLENGGAMVAFPPTKKVKNAKGKEVVQPVPVSEFKSLQWTVARLAPGASVTLKARMSINSR